VDGVEELCVDANVVVKVMVYEDLSEKARALMAGARKWL